MTAYDRIAWRQVAACMVILGCSGMVVSTYSIVAVPLGREFQPSRTMLMLAMTLMSGVTALLSPFAGSLMDKLSLRKLMGLGAIIQIVGFFLLSFSASFTHVLVVYAVLMALVNVLLGPIGATVLISRWFTLRRGRALGITLMGYGVGGLVFPIIIQALLDVGDWRTGLQLLALVLAFLTLPAAALIVNRPEDRGFTGEGTSCQDTSDDPMPEGPSVAVHPGLSVKDIFRDPTFWLLAAAFAVVLSGVKGLVTNLAPLVMDEGISGEVAAVLVSVFAASGFVSKLMFAAVADRIGPRLLLGFAVAGFAVGMACLIRVDLGLWLIIAGVVLVGFCGGMIVVLQSFLIPRIFGENVVGKVMGVLNLVVLVALLSSPLAFGYIFDVTGSYDMIFVIFAALSLLVLLIVLPLIRFGPADEVAVIQPEPARSIVTP